MLGRSTLALAVLCVLATFGAKASVNFHGYVDPSEQAFSVQVPAGWSVGGRMVRYGPISIAPFVQAIAPDGNIFVQLGDWHIQDFADIPGWAEGRLYTPGTSVEFVRRVRTADQYARAYALSFSKMLGCTKSEFGASETPMTPRGVTTAIPSATLQTSVAHFTCVRDSQKYVGQVMTSVQSYPLPMGTIAWNVLYLASVLSRADQASMGVAVWDRMRQSFAFLPAWSARESQIAAQAVKPAEEQLQATLGQARTFDREVLNGNTLVEDPRTGAREEVPIGVAPYYFTDGAGHSYNSYDPVARPGFHGANRVQGAQ